VGHAAGDHATRFAFGMRLDHVDQAENLHLNLLCLPVQAKAWLRQASSLNSTLVALAFLRLLVYLRDNCCEGTCHEFRNTRTC
jgi:hypothetical protein